MGQDDKGLMGDGDCPCGTNVISILPFGFDFQLTRERDATRSLTSGS